MFGFVKKAYKKAKKATKSLDPQRLVKGKVSIGKLAKAGLGGTIGLSTAYATRHPKKAVALVSSGGAAAPAVVASTPTLPRVVRKGALVAEPHMPASTAYHAPGSTRGAILSLARPGDATRLLPAMGAAERLVAATRARASRKAALQAVLQTRRLAKAGYHPARVGMTMLQIAAQKGQWDARGRMRIGRHYLNKFGRITRAV